jgi:hypothetical protein
VIKTRSQRSEPQKSGKEVITPVEWFFEIQRGKRKHETSKAPQLNTLRCHFVDSTGQAKEEEQILSLVPQGGTRDAEITEN